MQLNDGSSMEGFNLLSTNSSYSMTLNDANLNLSWFASVFASPTLIDDGQPGYTY